MAWPFPLNEDRACVTVKRLSVRKPHQYELVTGADSIGILRAGTKMLDLDGNIFTPEGEEVFPDGKFYITAETIDPYHLVVDMF